MKSYWSNYYTDESDSPPDSDPNINTLMNHIEFFLKIFAKYYRIDSHSLQNTGCAFVDIGTGVMKEHQIAEFPKVNSRIEVEMRLWCRCEHIIEVACSLRFNKTVIATYRAKFCLMKDVKSGEIIKIPQDIFERIGPHVKMYTKDQLDALVLRF